MIIATYNNKIDIVKLLISLGADIYTVQHLLAHKNVSTTQIYVAHASPKTREAANKIRLNSDEDNEKE